MKHPELMSKEFPAFLADACISTVLLLMSFRDSLKYIEDED